jgi:hypothetical protein
MIPHYTFLRHCESLSNKYHKDLLNPHLSLEGEYASKQLKKYYDYIIISPLNRTRETFNNSQLKAKYIEYNSLCRDHINSNTLSGLMDNEHINESQIEFNLRMNLLKIYLEYKGQLYNHILIITHHSVIKYLTSYDLDNGQSITVNQL